MATGKVIILFCIYAICITYSTFQSLFDVSYYFLNIPEYIPVYQYFCTVTVAFSNELIEGV